ncbi:hypothetical protein WI92_18670 [Burkholderia vietnamiensis]|nr:hypothetical protein WI92_18670 [Burkholderia vietnamiensis]
MTSQIAAVMISICRSVMRSGFGSRVGRDDGMGSASSLAGAAIGWPTLLIVTLTLTSDGRLASAMISAQVATHSSQIATSDGVTTMSATSSSVRLQKSHVHFLLISPPSSGFA